MKTLKNIFFVTVPMLLIFFLLLEVASRLFFPGTAEPKAVFDKENLLVKFNDGNGKSGKWTAGRFAQQRGKWSINNDGWNSPIDYVTERKPGVKRIAVIGDSYIEALQVDISESYPYLLADSLGTKYEVYTFGASGAPLSQYLHVGRHVEKKYSPDIYIFNLVHNDFHESISGLAYNTMFMNIKVDNDSTFTEVAPVEPERTYSKVPGGDILKKSSFFRYVYSNLHLKERLKSKKVAKEVEMNVAVNDIIDNEDSVRRTTYFILKKIKEELGNKEILFVMDGPRWNIYKGDVAQSKVTRLNTMVDEYCRELGLPLINMWEPMQKDWDTNKKRFETDYDSHWADYGHQFVAGLVLDYFRANKL